MTMKRNVILFSALLGIGYLTLSSYKNGPANGGAGNRTGSTTPPQTCSQGGCHMSESTKLSMSIGLLDNTTSMPVTDGKYIPGREYTVTLSGLYTGSSSYSHFGFQATAVNVSKVSIGTLAASMSGTHLNTTTGVSLVEHNAPMAAVTTGTYVATFKWTAPAAGAGAATFYARMVANNNNNTPGDDTPNGITATYNENTTSIGELSADILTKVYPNPAKDQLNIGLDNAQAGEYAFNVYNAFGIRVHSEIKNINSSSFETTVNTSAIAAGTYFVQIVKDGAVRTLPFTKL